MLKVHLRVELTSVARPHLSVAASLFHASLFHASLFHAQILLKSFRYLLYIQSVLDLSIQLLHQHVNYYSSLVSFIRLFGCHSQEHRLPSIFALLHFRSSSVRDVFAFVVSSIRRDTSDPFTL